MHFLNRSLLAPNVMTAPVDAEIVDEFKSLAHSPFKDDMFAEVKPDWASDVRWISPLDEQGFAVFQSAFDRMEIAKWVEPHLDIDREVRLYSGFLVIRTCCTDPSFHLDWTDECNQGLTLLTPIGRNAGQLGLLYERLDGTIGRYQYRRGEALILGSRFVHSSEPGQSQQPEALLSFTFGTDRMRYWPGLAATAARQGRFYRRPDGKYCFNE